MPSIVTEREERRKNPRDDRPLVSAEERALKGYARTVDEWPASMMRAIASINRYTNNPRINDPAVPDLMESLKDHGAQQPIVVRLQDDIVIVGDTRWLAATALGWPAFPVKRMPCDEGEARVYRLRDNKLGERAEWDYGRLKIEFEEIKAFGLDLPSTGFKDFEIQPILDSDWKAPAPGALPSGSADPEPAKAETGGDGQPRLTFNAVQWDRVQQACELFRTKIQQPDLAAAEILTRLAILYLAQGAVQPSSNVA